MSDEPADRLTFTQRTQETFVTVSAINLCHYITDDELDKLADLQREPLSEICFCAFGVLGGSLIPAINGAKAFASPTVAFNLADLLSISLACLSAGIAFLTAIMVMRRGGRTRTIVKDIRLRRKVKVSPAR